MGCTPVEQRNFPPQAGAVRAMLRDRIAGCQAVVHIVGEVYGSEPVERGEGEPRRSYTQLEYDIARELGKPVYVFICGDGFPYDEHEPEDEEKRRLQAEHRARLMGRDDLYTLVGTRDELEKRVLALQEPVKVLTRELANTRSWLARGVVVGLVLALLLVGGLLWLNQRTTQTAQQTERTEERLDVVETELDSQRRYIRLIANAYGEQQRQLEELKLTDEQLFDRALLVVAEREGIEPTELRSGVDLFVAAVRSDAEADFLDRALADFAEQRFASASENAARRRRRARTKRVAAEALAERATAEADVARDRSVKL